MTELKNADSNLYGTQGEDVDTLSNDGEDPDYNHDWEDVSDAFDDNAYGSTVLDGMETSGSVRDIRTSADMLETGYENVGTRNDKEQLGAAKVVY